MLRRSPHCQIGADTWQVLYGHFKPGENVKAGIKRELAEETGLKPERIFTVNEVLTFFEKNTGVINIVPVFAVLADHPCSIKLNTEHSEYRWADLEEAVDMLPWHGQKKILQVVNELFANGDPGEIYEI